MDTDRVHQLFNLDSSFMVKSYFLTRKSLIFYYAHWKKKNTFMAEKSRATPDCVQSLPTKGINWPRTSDLERN